MAWSSGGWGEVPWGGEADTDHLVVEGAAALDTTSTRLNAQASIIERGVNFEMVVVGAVLDSLVLERAVGVDLLLVTQNMGGISIIEAAAGLDTTVAQLSAQAIVIEAAAGLDFAAAVFAIIANVVEGAALSDRWTTGEFYEFLCVEGAVGRDVPTNAMDMLPMLVIEGAVARMLASPTLTMDAEIIEAGTIRDIAGARYRWEPVNDGQSGNWVPVNDTQPNPWTPIP